MDIEDNLKTQISKLESQLYCLETRIGNEITGAINTIVFLTSIQTILILLAIGGTQ